MRISKYYIYALVMMSSMVLLKCATDPGTSTPVAGSAITYFTYATGDVSVVVNVEKPKITAAAVLFDLNTTTGQTAQATHLEEGVTVTWPENLRFTLPDCSASPTLTGTDTFTTYKVYNYVYPASCITTGTVTAVADIIVNKVGSASTTISGTSNPIHTVFVTSTRFDGNLAGLTGADASCRTLALAGSKTSSLTGTWRAILSDDSTNAKDRITFILGSFLKNTNSQTVLSSASSLWNGGNLNAAIQYDENGVRVSTGYLDVFTATNTDGTKVVIGGGNRNCSNWSTDGSYSGYTGSLTETSPSWIYTGSYSPCDGWGPSGGFSLYCINSYN